MERDEEKRQRFQAEINACDPADLVYLDESGIDPRTYRQYARAPRGKQVIAEVQGKREKRTSLIAAWMPHSKNMIAPYAFEGSTDAKRFNGWIEQCLLPTLRKGQIIIVFTNYKFVNTMKIDFVNVDFSPRSERT